MSEPRSPSIIGTSPAIRGAVAEAERVAPTPVPVVLKGESGTGKELFASLIHRASGRRGAFVAVNCAALPEALVESVLFGHRRGAFSGALEASPGLVMSADGGTLFLDEVGELALPVQAKLLRVLQQGTVLAVGETRERRVDVRVVAASHRELRALAAAGSFREDLYFRLARFEIAIPALRDRGRDVVAIARAYLAESSDLAGCRRALGKDAERILVRYRWPGNVRELQNVLFRAALLARGTAIGPTELRAALGAGDATEGTVPVAALAAEAPVRRRDVADALGVSRATAGRRLRALVNAGELVQRGGGCGARYALAAESVDPRSAQALEIARREGRVTRRSFSREAGVPARTAGRLLSKLVADGLLAPDGASGNAGGYVFP